MRNVSLVLLSVLAALAGCGPTDGIGNAAHRNLMVRADSDTEIAVWISGEPGGACPLARRDLQGTVNGMPLTVLTFGKEGGFGPCEAPALVGPSPGLEPLEVRVSDSTGEIRATFATSPREKRSLALVEPADGQLFIGDRVVLRYTPASDQLSPNNGPLGFTTSWWETPFSRDGEVISFVVPEAQALTLGETELTFWATVHGETTSCRGADSCLLPISMDRPMFPVTLVQNERGAPDCYQCACTYSDGTTGGQWNTTPTDDFIPLRCSAVQCERTDKPLTVVSAACAARTVAEVSLPYPHEPGKSTPKPP